MDLLFKRGVSARQFASTKVDVFEENVEGGGVMSQYEEKMGASDSQDENVTPIGADVKTAYGNVGQAHPGR